MKRLIFICTLIFCFFCCFATVVTVSDSGFSYLVSFDSISFSGPPVFSYNKDSLYLGEIRPSGLFKYIQDPSVLMLDFGSTKAFERVSTPAINPSFIGIGKTFTWGDFAAFYPFGVYLDVGNKKVYGALMVSSENSNVNSYLVNWQEVYKGLWYRGICGFYDTFSKGRFSFKSSEYVWILTKQSGAIGNTGWNIAMNYDENGISGYCRLGQIKTYGYAIDLSSLSIMYRYDVHAKAIYGGTAQKKAIEFSYRYKWNNFTFKAINKATADSDSGKTTSSEYEISYESSGISSSLVVGLNRPSEMPMTVSKFRFNFSTPNATFGIIGTKSSMSFRTKESMYIFGSLLDINVSIDQNRQCSINAKLSI